jgi:cell division septation protein DedD
MDGMSSMRDLDQIREREDGRDPARTVVLAIGGLAAACVLFAAGVLIGRDNDSRSAPRHEDPLARLDALAAQAARAPSPEVTYPSHLAERRTEPGTSALAGAAPPAPRAAGSAPTIAAAASSPESARPAAPLSVAGASAHVGEPPLGTVRPAVLALRPAAATLAPSAARDAGPAASPGADGAFNLQVSSFRTVSSAQAFAQRMRERGHHAFVASTTATTPTGTWHRVRIGPFNSLREVSQYRSSFEARERLPTFIVRRDATPASR